MTLPLNFDALVERCRKTHEEIQSRTARSIDLALVARNWLFGWYIVEYEQVRGFKIGVTKWYRQQSDASQIWQRNYWEHIIRNEPELNRIRQYIVNNPMKWEQDSLRHSAVDAKNYIRESRPAYGLEIWMV